MAPTHDSPSADPPAIGPMLPIETARLTLRLFAEPDLDDLYAYQQLPEVAQFLYWGPRDRNQARESLDHKRAQSGLSTEGDYLVLAAVWRDVGRVVGEVSLRWASQEHYQGEVGFVFHPRYQAKGLATEAGRAALDLAFLHFGLHRVFGRCDTRNTASARLMERLGMRREAHLVENEIFKGEWGDEYVYARLAREWTAEPRR